jgi:hypothetical protein
MLIACFRIVMLGVVALSVIMLSVVMLSIIMLSVDMLSAIMLSVVMLSVIMLSVVKLNVVAPIKHRLLNLLWRRWGSITSLCLHQGTLTEGEGSVQLTSSLG